MSSVDLYSTDDIEGIEIEAGYKIQQESYRVYKVINTHNGHIYRVWSNGDRERYTCTCPVFIMQTIACKHIKIVLKLEGKIL